VTVVGPVRVPRVGRGWSRSVRGTSFAMGDGMRTYWTGRLRVCVFLALLGAFVAPGAPVAQGSLALRDLARLSGQSESDLRGVGFVMGLPGTGDSPAVVPMARQLAELLEQSGSPVPDLAELLATRNIAMVMVTCTVPKEGALPGDKFDVHVQAMFDAESLVGGRLFITPLLGPKASAPGERFVWAYAEGELVFDGATPTVARSRRAAQVVAPIPMRTVARDGTITLVVHPRYAGWTTTRLIADAINSDRQGFDGTLVEIARAVNEREVRVSIPEPELEDPSGFIAGVQEINLDPSLLSLPAKVVVNDRRGTIVVSGNVQISPAVISHRDLVITTVTPEREPTPQQPEVIQSSWAGVETSADDRQRAALEDLLEALRQLNVSVQDQIAILRELHRLGHLHAEFVEE